MVFRLQLYVRCASAPATLLLSPLPPSNFSATCSLLLYATEHLPRSNDTLTKLARSALIGFCSSAVSDTCSNSIRVIKVYKQANSETISYPEAVRRVIKEDGLAGLFGRGLSTKIVANGLQGLMFSVLWKLIDEQLFKKDAK